MMPEFRSFEKLVRLSREVVITEKIDGTNALVYVPEDSTEPLIAGSRNRWIPAGGGHFGFEQWVQKHSDELRLLGPGYHYGEWWGPGIGRRGYNLPKDEKRWSLFNASRWEQQRPACCAVVPIVTRGIFTTHLVEEAMDKLRSGGSLASPGFMRPEGIVIFHTQGRVLFKKTFEHDEAGKGE